MNRLGKDMFQVQTPLGTFSVQSAITLPQGGALVMQLQSQTPLIQFLINTLNGVPPGPTHKPGKGAPLSPKTPGLGGATGSAHTSAQSARSTGPSTLPKLTPGNVLQAVLMRPLSQSTTAGPAFQPVAPASRGAINPAAQVGPAMTKPAAPSTTPLDQTTTMPSPAAKGRPPMGGMAQNSARGSPGITPQTGGYLPTGSQLKVRITTVQLPNPSAATSTPPPMGASTTPSSLSAGTSLSGLVTGSTPSGHPIVQTRAGVIALTTETVVPRGSVVQLDVVSGPKAPAPLPGAGPSLHQTMFTSRNWPALEEVFQVLREASQPLAQQAVQTAVPRPNTGLTAGMIFFLSALRGGELRSWIGDAPLRVIERVRPNLLGKITEDFTTLARLADEPTTGDWRVALIPINTGSAIEQIRMLLRQNANEEDEETNGNADTRFVIDVDLSRLGRLQLDGLVRNKGKVMDLILRTQHPLETDMRNDIRTIFHEAADITGLKGSINFQAAPPEFVDIPDPLGQHDLGLVV